ncbi:hypothetical protein M514_17260 [Trichuris suis]|uniref:Uncharacterized protein n=1 Tax=Trichuris suis TaxID=68888 RepID=A0A085NLX1_9BILA|nr:hypothetical protein M514_17260 [Trichuris suis]
MAASSNGAFKTCPQQADMSGSEEDTPVNLLYSSETVATSEVLNANIDTLPESATVISKEGQHKLFFKWKERKSTIDYDKTLTQCFKKCGRSSMSASQMVLLQMPSRGYYASPKFTKCPSASSLPPPPDEWLLGFKRSTVQGNSAELPGQTASLSVLSQR